MDKNYNLIRSIDKIARSDKYKRKVKKQNGVDHELDLEKVLEEHKEDVENVAEAFGCSGEEAIIFSIIFFIQLNLAKNEIEIKDIADYIGITPIELIHRNQLFNGLFNLNIIQKESSVRPKRARRGKTFQNKLTITPEAYNAVINDDLFASESQNSNLELFDLLENAGEIIRDHDKEEISFNQMEGKINQLLSSNGELAFIKNINKLNLTSHETLLLLYICHEVAGGDKTVNLPDACEKVVSSLQYQFRLRKRLLDGRSNLIKNNIVRLDEGSFKSDKGIRLTEIGLEYLFQDEYDIIRLQTTDGEDNDLLSPQDIKEKQLFFNQREQEQLDFLQNIVGEDEYHQVSQRLKEKGMNKGLTVLFYGSSGTGKTESVYQIARNTDRHILSVDISSVRTKWYGESQKLLKKVFEKYKNKMSSLKKAPILLFNEADAVIHNRMNNAQDSTDQTENSLQNILLQEIEDFEGIMIATTNLSSRLDKAFERRFLYKVEFQNPSTEVKASIWKNKLPKLKKGQAEELATTYDLTGGEIENIAKKYLMQEVLHGNEPNIRELKEYCEEEKLNNTNGKIIGFGVN